MGIEDAYMDINRIRVIIAEVKISSHEAINSFLKSLVYEDEADSLKIKEIKSARSDSTK